MADTEITGYRFVKADILRRIREGVFAPGEILPGEVSLAEQFGCARATVNRAMRELSDEGFVDRRRKAGTRVKAKPTRRAAFEIPQIRAEIEALGQTYRYALVERQCTPAPGWLKARLGLAPEARVLHLTCMHFAQNTPFQFEDRWINISVVPQAEFASFDQDGPNEWLVQQIPFTEAEISFSATAASADLSEYLQMNPGEPVFTAERSTWLSGAPVTHARLYYASGYRMTTRY